MLLFEQYYDPNTIVEEKEEKVAIRVKPPTPTTQARKKYQWVFLFPTPHGAHD